MFFSLSLSLSKLFSFPTLQANSSQHQAHIIKNPMSKTSKAIRKLNSKHRYFLTGTPIQNSLSEYVAAPSAKGISLSLSLTHIHTHTHTHRYRHLLVFAAGSSFVLNDEDEDETFRQHVQNPIERGAARDATDIQKRRAISLTRSLHEAARPFVLRRK